MTEAPQKFETCPSCTAHRAEGRLEEAIDCFTCRGRGIVRTAASWACNRCGGPLCPDVQEGDPNGRIPHGLVDVGVVGGYDSRSIFDMTKYVFSICEPCLRLMFEEFKVKPRVFDVDVRGNVLTEDGYEQDRRFYLDRMWRDQEQGHIRALLGGRCNADFMCEERAKYRVYYSSSPSTDTCCEAHRRRFENTINATFVPIELAGTKVETGEGPDEQHRVAESWIRAVQVHGNEHAILHWRFAPACLRPLFPQFSDEDFHEGRVEATWVPRGEDVPSLVHPEAFAVPIANGKVLAARRRTR